MRINFTSRIKVTYAKAQPVNVRFADIAALCNAVNTKLMVFLMLDEILCKFSV